MSELLLMLATALYLGRLCHWLLRNSQAGIKSENTLIKGGVSPRKLLPSLAIICCVFGIISVVWEVILDPDKTIFGFMMLLLVIGISTFCALLLSGFYHVSWDENGISGANKIYDFVPGFERINMSWDEVAGVGYGAYGYVESTDGCRIYWRYIYYNRKSLRCLLGAIEHNSKLKS